MVSTTKKVDVKKLLSKYSIVLILIVIMAICAIANDRFLTLNNLINVCRQQSVIIIIAFGEMALIICGQLDLSCGAVIALSGCLSVYTYKATQNILLAFAVAVVVAVFVNLLNGIMVTKFMAPAFIATLATQTMARGAVLYITNGQNIYEIGDYAVVGQGSVGIIPIPVIFMVVIFVIIAYMMRHTHWGRSTYAVGGNAEAANASGINTKMVINKAYLLNGVLVGIAAVLFMSRVNGGLPAGADGYEMDGLTATIVGGTSFTGGIGTPWGTVVGAFVVGFLSNIMNLMSIDSYIQQIVKGAIIAIAVIWDIYSKSRQTYKKGK
jgi:inositol transport system permease protein